MMFYLTMFLGFFYLKVFRVRRLHEGPSIPTYTAGFFAISSLLVLIVFGLINMTWYIVLIFAFAFFIISALMISAVQLGMFKDGKPILVMAQIYNLMLPLSIIIVALTATIIFL